MNPIDVIVGRNVRERRVAAGLSQEDLGAALGVSFQQIQKYEKGTNRISASRLVAIASVMRVPIATLFDGVAEEAKEIETRTLAEMQREHKVVDKYRLLPDDVQKAMCTLVEAMTLALAQNMRSPAQ
jgi:transcriptional regulator with XRE-family HTH domain